MKWIKNLVFGIGLMAMVGACLKQPEYSNVPEIAFQDMYLGSKVNRVDSLVLSFNFKDGDGDLGLDSNLDSADITYQSPLYGIYFEDGEVRYTPKNDYTLPQLFQVSSGQIVNGLYYLTWDTKKTVPTADTLPDLNCTSWELLKELKDDKYIVKDTLYIKQNLNYSNIFLDVYVKQNDGTFSKYNVSYTFPNCSPYPFNGRFGNLTNDRGKNSPLEGTIHYSMNVAWRLTFSFKTLKLKFYIQDRALHKSNVIETKEFTLASITR